MRVAWMSLPVVISSSRHQLYLKTLSSSGSVYPLSWLIAVFGRYSSKKKKKREEKRKGKAKSRMEKKGGRRKRTRRKQEEGERGHWNFFLRFKKKRYFNKVTKRIIRANKRYSNLLSLTAISKFPCGCITSMLWRTRKREPRRLQVMWMQGDACSHLHYSLILQSIRL